MPFENQAVFLVSGSIIDPIMVIMDQGMMNIYQTRIIYKRLEILLNSFLVMA
ncbi:hypothetical protein SAMN05443550_101126 [Pedobacter hartonius]|uniref:Uncharacterized protein n=1 Tax=Pedobacter hartonius TaxID=425514 RepID=A0A1H3W765_9SPHI|nr:hypothetical protein SAMN05443550_101126 [Pedobacter hartonius]